MTTAPGATRAPPAEVLGLLAGLRRAWRLRLPDRELPTWRASARRRGWAFAVAEPAVATRPGGHGLREHGHDGPAGHAAARLVILGPAVADVERALRLETEALAAPVDDGDGAGDARARLQPAALRRTVDRHRALGELYGYPACCVDAFSDAHLEVLLHTAPRVGDNLAAIVRAARRSDAFVGLLDTLDGGAYASQRSPLRHLPCRFDCPASLDLAQRLRSLERDATERPDDAAAWQDADAPHDVVLLADGAMLRLAPARHAPATPGRWGAAHLVGVDAVDRRRLGALPPPLPRDGSDPGRPTPTISVDIEPGFGLRWGADGRSGRIDAVIPGPWGAWFPLVLPFASGVGRLPVQGVAASPAAGS